MSTAENNPKPMSRLISFWILVAIIVLLAILFFRVIAAFMIPLFLAAVLVVIFNPFHRWLVDRLGGRRRIAAGATTAVVMLIVLVPVGLLVTFSLLESRTLVRQFNTDTILESLRQLRTHAGLDWSHADSMRGVENHLQATFDQVVERKWTGGSADAEEYLSIELAQLERESSNLASTLDLPWTVQDSPSDAGSPVTRSWLEYVSTLKLTRQKVAQQRSRSEGSGSGQAGADEAGDSEDGNGSEDRGSEAENAEEIADLEAFDGEPDDWVRVTLDRYRDFKSAWLGGRMRASLVELVNPTREQVTSYSSQVVRTIRERLLSLGEATLTLVVKLIIGVFIMIIAVFFFLLDGPAMVQTGKALSPLSDDYENELIGEFEEISRAIVVASLLSAVAQGILAGFGYFFADLESVFLLTLLTMMFALVPFVGTSLVWVPCCFYLYFIEGRLVAAIVLGLYAMLVVSQIDNLIKPLVLHGQSKIHPLLALLSILGGVATLGPIGILIGPMVVAFLQTLLKLLQREITQLDNETPAAREAT